MKKRLLIILIFVSIILTVLCLYFSGAFQKKKVYTREELEQIQRDVLFQEYKDHIDDKDHWIHYISIHHIDEENNCIRVIMLEENREHLPEVKEHLKGYPIEYRFTDKIVVEEQSGAEGGNLT